MIAVNVSQAKAAAAQTGLRRVRGHVVELLAALSGRSAAPTATGALPKGTPKFSNEMLFELD